MIGRDKKKSYQHACESTQSNKSKIKRKIDRIFIGGQLNLNTRCFIIRKHVTHMLIS